MAYTLEHAYLFDHQYDPKVHAGVYLCIRGDHRLSEGSLFETFELQVPKHSGIIFHAGNYNQDSKGCILLGERIVMSGQKPGSRMLLNSIKTFNKFMKHLDGIDQFELIIKE